MYQPLTPLRMPDTPLVRGALGEWVMPKHMMAVVKKLPFSDTDRTSFVMQTESILDDVSDMIVRLSEQGHVPDSEELVAMDEHTRLIWNLRARLRARVRVLATHLMILKLNDDWRPL